MWVITTEGTYSAVAIDAGRGRPSPGLKVRARVRDDLVRLLAHFTEGEQPLVLKRADIPWEVRCECDEDGTVGLRICQWPVQSPH